MRRQLTDAEVISACLGTIAAIFVGGLLGSVRSVVDQANAALVLALVIVVAAWAGGRWAGGATALAAAASFDFFLTKPYGSLTIKSTDDVITTGLLFVVGIGVGQLAASRSRAASRAHAGSDQVGAIYRLAQLTTTSAPLSELIESVEREVAEVLQLERCTFSLMPPEPPLPTMEQTGRVDTWYVHEGEGFALPPEGVTIPVRHGDHSLGWLVCTPRPGIHGISRDRRRTALTLAGQLALALASDAHAA